MDPAVIAFKRRQLASLVEAHPEPAPHVAAAIDRLRAEIDPAPHPAEAECVSLRREVEQLRAEIARLLSPE